MATHDLSLKHQVFLGMICRGLMTAMPEGQRLENFVDRNSDLYVHMSCFRWNWTLGLLTERLQP